MEKQEELDNQGNLKKNNKKKKKKEFLMRKQKNNTIKMNQISLKAILLEDSDKADKIGNTSLTFCCAFTKIKAPQQRKKP